MTPQQPREVIESQHQSAVCNLMRAGITLLLIPVATKRDPVQRSTQANRRIHTTGNFTHKRNIASRKLSFTRAARELSIPIRWSRHIVAGEVQIGIGRLGPTD